MRLADIELLEKEGWYLERTKDCHTEIKLLSNVPTAYDVEEVVKELEANFFPVKDVCGNPITTIVLKDAIEIVQKGGTK